MKIIGDPNASLGDAQRGRHSVWSALLFALLIATAVAMFLPFMLFVLMIGMIPGISDLAWAIAQFPVKLLNLPLPTSDSAGYTFTMAGRIYAVLVFLVVFGVKVRRNHNQQNVETENPNNAYQFVYGLPSIARNQIDSCGCSELRAVVY